MTKKKNDELDIDNKFFAKIVHILDHTFDYIFLFLSIATVVFTFVLLFDFGKDVLNKGFDIESLFEVGLTALISVKFYKVIKDYIGDHKIELSNLAEIGIVAILSELIFKIKIEAYSISDILIRILFLIILIVFYYYEEHLKNTRKK